ncbi:MAG: Vms1/Ankzf1 family peptidyl-tRNA hydrolase [Candidatus Krumholzibacteriia bacterium]
MPFTRELRELQAIPPTYPFVSVYLTVGHNEESAEAMRVFVRTRFRQALSEARNARERAHLETDARHVSAFLEDVIHARVERKSQGLAIFACAKRKIFQVVGSVEPFQNLLVVSERPVLEPLKASNGGHRILACLVDSRSARILELGPGNVQAQAEIQSDVRRRHRQGGWSQMRFQHHVDDQIDHHHREVATALTNLSDREPQLPVVLAGPEKVVASFRAHLPDRVRQRIVVGLPIALKSHERDIVERVLASFQRGEESRHEQELERQLDEALAPSRGARGIEDVLHAANEHAIRRLFVNSEFDERGWRCKGCGALGSQVPLTCSFCGGSVESTDVRPELISKVLASGGEVAAFPAGRHLQHGVVALLRYRA